MKIGSSELDGFNYIRVMSWNYDCELFWESGHNMSEVGIL